MRTVCCVCGKVKCNGDWLEQLVECEVRVSHGFCPECFDKTMARFFLARSIERAPQPSLKPLEQNDVVSRMAKTV